MKPDLHANLPHTALLALFAVCACQPALSPGQDSDSSATDPLAPAFLTDLQEVPAGKGTCLEGGVVILAGFDDGAGAGTADDGILDPGEVLTSVTLCHGIDGTPGRDGTDSLPLVRVDTLARGSSACPAGGQALHIGRDDGAGGGIAGDGVLQSGEIVLTREVCHGLDALPGTPAPLMALAPSSANDCPAGGWIVRSGLDDGKPAGTAGDGILDPSEVDWSGKICLGTASAAALARTNVLSPGPVCLEGGTQLQFGVDDGAGGGIAFDFTLQNGEVRQTSIICAGVDHDIDPAFTSPPPSNGLPGNALLRSAGGRGLVGGHGGQIAIEDLVAADGAWMRIHPTGSVTLTAPPTPRVPLEDPDTALVLGAQTLYLVPDPFVVSGMPGGTLYAIEGESGVYAVSQPNPVSAIHVTTDSSLRFDDRTYASSHRFDLGVPLIVEGTLTFWPARDDDDTLVLSSSALWLATSGTLQIDASLFTNTGPLQVHLDVPATLGDPASGRAILRGHILAAGVAATPSDKVADLRISADTQLWLGGTIDVSAPSHDFTRNGTQSGSLDVRSAGSLWLDSPTLLARGGKGQQGGPGGQITLQAASLTGNAQVDARGGDTTPFPVEPDDTDDTDAFPPLIPPCQGCAGGAGGQIVVQATRGPIRLTGEWLANGGNADETEQGTGGAGGQISWSLQAPLTANGVLNGPVPASIELSATLDASGGNASWDGTGGVGGTLHLSRAGNLPTDDGFIAIFGTQALDVRGGDVLETGGSTGAGGQITLTRQARRARSASDPAPEDQSVLAGIVIDTTLRLDAGTCAGTCITDCAGQAFIGLYGSVAHGFYGTVLRGELSARTSPALGSICESHGASLEVAGACTATLAGTFDFTPSALAQGTGQSPTSRSADSPTVDLSCEGPVSLASSGQIRTRGGDSTEGGGQGGAVVLSGRSVTLAGLIDTRGGDALESGRGGAGGDIVCDAQERPADLVNATLETSGGEGPLAQGREGRIFSNGTLSTPDATGGFP